MFIIGGRQNNSNFVSLPIQVFNLNTSQIFDFPHLEMIRHSSFIFEKNIYLYGGLDNIQHKNSPINVVSMICMKELFKNSPLIDIIEENNQYLTKKLKKKIKN